MAIVSLDTPIGFPPEEDRLFHSVDNRLLALPIVEIKPCIPDYTRGSTVYRLKDCFRQGSSDTPAYIDLLESHGYTIEGESCLKIAYLADSFPTDTITNEYGDSILSRLTGTISTTAADVTQIFGRRGVKETAAEFMNKYAGDSINELQGMTSKGSGSSPGIFSHINTLLGGGRIDFPQLWRGSSFRPSYTLTVRLFNPDPGNLEATKKYIIGPIAAILLLGCPISQSGFTYSWPYLHKIKSRGIFDLNSGYISSITVIKGGDQLQIGFNQRLGVVDVRIEFGSVFNTMVAMQDVSLIASDRPTVIQYIKEMEDFKNSEIDSMIPYADIDMGAPPSTSMDDDSSRNVSARTTENDKILSAALAKPRIHDL